MLTLRESRTAKEKRGIISTRSKSEHPLATARAACQRGLLLLQILIPIFFSFLFEGFCRQFGEWLVEARLEIIGQQCVCFIFKSRG